jgi:hypothetical protein
MDLESVLCFMFYVCISFNVLCMCITFYISSILKFLCSMYVSSIPKFLCSMYVSVSMFYVCVSLSTSVML